MSYWPEPLTKKEQDELLRKLPDKDAQETLITHSMRLVEHIARKFSNTNYLEDFTSVGCIGLIKAVNTFDYSKGNEFSTYATRCIENEILMFLRKNKKHDKLEISKETILAEDDDGRSLTIEDICEDKKAKKDMEVYENYDEAMMVLNDVSNQLYRKSTRDLIIYMYMISGKTQIEVADLIGLSQSYVCRLYKKYRKKSKQAFKECHKSKNEDDLLHFYKVGENLCLKIPGYPTIKTTFEVESFEEIGDFLRFNLM